MNKEVRNWKLILNSNNYHSIFIKGNGLDNPLILLYKHLNELNEIDDFSIILPTIQEFEMKDTSKYLVKFAPMLKSFIDEKNKRTLITEERILNTLLKPEKRESFFRFLMKQKKNIIIFCESDYEKYVLNIQQNYNYLIMEYEEWVKSLDVLGRFSDIKVAISKTHNPFKNPLVAFKKYNQE